jgi:hypothetical protein
LLVAEQVHEITTGAKEMVERGAGHGNPLRNSAPVRAGVSIPLCDKSDRLESS